MVRHNVYCVEWDEQDIAHEFDCTAEQVKAAIQFESLSFAAWVNIEKLRFLLSVDELIEASGDFVRPFFARKDGDCSLSLTAIAKNNFAVMAIEFPPGRSIRHI